jgi:hypothetical protein
MGDTVAVLLGIKPRRKATAYSGRGNLRRENNPDGKKIAVVPANLCASMSPVFSVNLA